MYCGTQSSGAATLDRHSAKYGFDNGVLFNRYKSVCKFVVKPRGLNISTPLMNINDDAIENVDKVKYFGVLLCQVNYER